MLAGLPPGAAELMLEPEHSAGVSLPIGRDRRQDSADGETRSSPASRATVSWPALRQLSVILWVGIRNAEANAFARISVCSRRVEAAGVSTTRRTTLPPTRSVSRHKMIVRLP